MGGLRHAATELGVPADHPLATRVAGQTVAWTRAAGVYFLSLSSGKEVDTLKLIKLRK
jgi:hypothetical protein